MDKIEIRELFCKEIQWRVENRKNYTRLRNIGVI